MNLVRFNFSLWIIWILVNKHFNFNIIWLERIAVTTASTTIRSGLIINPLTWGWQLLGPLRWTAWGRLITSGFSFIILRFSSPLLKQSPGEFGSVWAFHQNFVWLTVWGEISYINKVFFVKINNECNKCIQIIHWSLNYDCCGEPELLESVCVFMLSSVFSALCLFSVLPFSQKRFWNTNL